MLGNWASVLRGSRMEEVWEVNEPRARGRRLRPSISHEFIVRTYSSTWGPKDLRLSTASQGDGPVPTGASLGTWPKEGSIRGGGQ